MKEKSVFKKFRDFRKRLRETKGFLVSFLFDYFFTLLICCAIDFIIEGELTLFIFLEALVLTSFIEILIYQYVIKSADKDNEK